MRKRKTYRVGDVLENNGVYFQPVENDNAPRCFVLKFPEHKRDDETVFLKTERYQNLHRLSQSKYPTVIVSSSVLNDTIKNGETTIVFNSKELLDNLLKRINT